MIAQLPESKGYALSTAVDQPFDATLEATRTALVDQGFGVLTEIDMAATLRSKLGAEIPPQVILGACRPPLALAAITAEPSVGLLLPCNVVVRAETDSRTLVEVLDPAVMVDLTGNTDLRAVAEDARHRLGNALSALGS